ncbi:hypothetical protein [Candidatus Methanomethylophilus sp. 1R26]|uniref:hypothetical protein n=1 Tax=Candidatus Methanomethylophilus sp. 1R26 TaxID=1769296 RepID=UPI00373FE18E
MQRSYATALQYFEKARSLGVKDAEPRIAFVKGEMLRGSADTPLPLRRPFFPPDLSLTSARAAGAGPETFPCSRDMRPRPSAVPFNTS